MIEDPVEAEQWLALSACLCFCCAWGAFYGSMQVWRLFGTIVDEMFQVAAILSLVGLVLTVLARFQLPTRIWVHFYRKAMLSH